MLEEQTACAMDVGVDVLRHQLPLSIGDKLAIQMKPYCDSF